MNKPEPKFKPGDTVILVRDAARRPHTIRNHFWSAAWKKWYYGIEWKEKGEKFLGHIEEELIVNELITKPKFQSGDRVINDLKDWTGTIIDVSYKYYDAFDKNKTAFYAVQWDHEAPGYGDRFGMMYSDTHLSVGMPIRIPSLGLPTKRERGERARVERLKRHLNRLFKGYTTNEIAAALNSLE